MMRTNAPRARRRALAPLLTLVLVGGAWLGGCGGGKADPPKPTPQEMPPPAT